MKHPRTSTPLVNIITLAALSATALLASCAGEPRAASTTDTSPAPMSPPASAQATNNPYPGVNSVAHDRDIWQQLLSDHTKLRRTVVYTATGVEATTESDDAAVAARIKEHAAAMQARMKTGAQVRVWDPVFTELFKKHSAVRLAITPTDKGVSIVESSDDPEAVALLWSHAAGVSDFVREGHAAGRRETPRIKAGSPVPPPEVAIGGVKHRVLLSQPDAAQVAALKASGVNGLVNFRKPAEHADYDESRAAAEAGITYCALPYKDASELTGEVIDAARAALRDGDAKGQTLALHCRTGNRVGPGWIAWRVLDQGVPIEQAVGEAKVMRMVDPRYEPIAREYVKRHAKPN